MLKIRSAKVTKKEEVEDLNFGVSESDLIRITKFIAKNAAMRDGYRLQSITCLNGEIKICTNLHTMFGEVEIKGTIPMYDSNLPLDVLFNVGIANDVELVQAVNIIFNIDLRLDLCSY